MRRWLPQGALPRVSVRMRLTLLYGGLFLLAGTALLALTYGLVRANFSVPVTMKVTGANGGEQQLFVMSVRRQVPTGNAGVIARTPDDQPYRAPTKGSLSDFQPPSPAALQAYQRQLEAAAYRQFLTWSGLALAVMAIVSVWLGWIVAGRVLRPLQAVTAAAKRLSGQNLHRERIALERPEDELKELADTIDAMLERLDGAFSSQRRFVANASHELRTPLAIVRTEVDVALANPGTSVEDLRAMAERVRHASERSERLIDGLLLLARSERELRDPEVVDLAEVAAEALSHARQGAERLGLKVSPVLGAAPVRGDRALLERLAANLVENAVLHNQRRGWIEVDTGVIGGQAELRVASSGPPIPPGEADSLFEPFHRVGRQRTGSDRGVGLGLSIVRSVASAHGGEAAARALPDGGLEVVVHLPRVPALVPA